MLVKMWGSEPHTLLVEMQNGSPALEINLAVSLEVKHLVLYFPS
jgi:hypothetical protein